MTHPLERRPDAAPRTGCYIEMKSVWDSELDWKIQRHTIHYLLLMFSGTCPVFHCALDLLDLCRPVLINKPTTTTHRDLNPSIKA